MSKAEKTALSKLGHLMNELDPIIKRHVSGLSAEEANQLLTKHKNYLKIDLVRDIEASSGGATGFDFSTPGKGGSPFDDLLSSYLDK